MISRSKLPLGLGQSEFAQVEATSGFSEQTTPASQQILDANASVSSIRFVDKDLESEDQRGSLKTLHGGEWREFD